MSETDLKPTHRGRKTRIENLLNFIKNSKKLTIEEVYKYALNQWMISTRIVSDYLKDLAAAGKIKIESEVDGDYVIYTGD